MKKYFVAGTDEQLVFGDVIQVELEKECGNIIHRVDSNITFTEEAIPFLLGMKVIEVKEEEKEEKKLINFHVEEDGRDEDDDEEDWEPCNVVETLLQKFETLEKSIENLIDVMQTDTNQMLGMLDVIAKNTKEKKLSSPSNKK